VECNLSRNNHMT